MRKKDNVENCLRNSNFVPFVIGMKYRLVLMINVGLKSTLLVNVDEFSLDKFVLLWPETKKYKLYENCSKTILMYLTFI
jgi:hypothetical protein